MLRAQGATGSLVADHLDGDKFNDALDNLVPSCHTCNASRTSRITPGELFIIRSDGTKRRARQSHCPVCGVEFLVGLDQKPPKGIYCSRSCARRASRQL
jgi:hypothetical protein